MMTRKGRGVEIPSIAIGRSGGQADRTPPLHSAQCGQHFDRIAWAGDLVVLASAAILIEHIEDSCIPSQSPNRAATIKIKGHTLRAECDLETNARFMACQRYSRAHRLPPPHKVRVSWAALQSGIGYWISTLIVASGSKLARRPRDLQNQLPCRFSNRVSPVLVQSPSFEGLVASDALDRGGGAVMCLHRWLVQFAVH